MKYFTKEWYELGKKTSFHLSLEEEKQVETFSEQYFQQLYNIKLNNSLKLQQEVASYIAESETADGDYIEHKRFDREKATELFYNQFIFNQDYIKDLLPKNILNEIADIRVFILDKATRNVIDAVTQFCEQNVRSRDSAIEEYRKYYKESLKSFDKIMVENIGFHDCVIISSKKEGKSLILIIDNSRVFTDIDEVVFENYNIIKQEGLLENSWWLYNEIYKVNDKYELHILLQNRNSDLIELIISFENIAFNSNKNKN